MPKMQLWAVACVLSLYGATSAAEEQSPLSCRFDILSNSVTCDVVADTVNITDIKLNRGGCEYFPSATRNKRVDYDAIASLPFATRRQIYEGWITYFQLLLMKHPDIQFGISVGSSQAPLLQNIMMLQMLRDLHDPELEASYKSLMSIKVSGGTSMADLIGGPGASFGEGLFAVAAFLGDFGPLSSDLSFGQQVSLPITGCANLLEYEIEANGTKWTWKNY